MTRYTDDSLEKVRDAVEMVDLVGARTELRRAGVNRYEGLCPFHDERTPSFGIDPVKKVYYCFGCGEGGDAFDFVRMTEGLDFKGALEHLADRYGVRLEPVEEDPATAARRRERERLLELLERTAAFYVRYLWDSGEAAGAREYLAGRGLDEATLREFRTYDRFRRRIMFPLCDSRGRVLGFGARAMGADQKPKYLNSSDNAVYHKGRHLFGADIARAPAAQAQTVIVAEGYTDVIALHQAGLRHTVGLMGTALTDEQVGELARLAPTVLLALDADAAGQEAMLRAARVAAGRNLTLRVVPLPVGSDPADLVAAEGARAMADRVDASVPFVRFRVERELAAADLSGAEGKDAVIAALRPVFRDMPASAMREELIGLVADRTELAPALVASWLAQGSRAVSGQDANGANGGQQRAPAPPQPALDAAGRAERSFLAQCLASPVAGRAALAEMELDAEFSSDLTRRAAAHVLAQLAGGGAALPEGDDELATLIAALTVLSGGMRDSEAAVEGERLSLEVQRVKREIGVAKAAAAGDVGRLVALRQELERRRDGAIARAIEETHATD